MSTEVHQFCIYCDVDVIAAHPHDDTCPIKTGFYPVLPRDVEQEISCAGCRHFFEVGEYFTHRVREGFHNPFGKDSAVGPTCLDCALIDLKEAA